MFEVAMLTALFGLVVWTMVAGAGAKHFVAAEEPGKKSRYPDAAAHREQPCTRQSPPPTP